MTLNLGILATERASAPPGALVWQASVFDPGSSGAGTTSITVPLPPTDAAGFLRFAWICGATTGATPSYDTPAGWTLVTHAVFGTRGAWLFGREMVFGDANNVVIPVTGGAGGHYFGGTGHSFSGQLPSTWLDAASCRTTGSDVAPGPTAFGATAITTTAVDGIAAFGAVTSSFGSFAPSAGYTERFDHNTCVSFLSSGHCLDQIDTDPAAGSVPGPTITCTGGNGFPFLALVGIKLA